MTDTKTTFWTIIPVVTLSVIIKLEFVKYPFATVLDSLIVLSILYPLIRKICFKTPTKTNNSVDVKSKTESYPTSKEKDEKNIWMKKNDKNDSATNNPSKSTVNELSKSIRENIDFEKNTCLVIGTTSLNSNSMNIKKKVSNSAKDVITDNNETRNDSKQGIEIKTMNENQFRCQCAISFLPPGMLQSFGPAVSVFKLGTGQCYHKL